MLKRIILISAVFAMQVYAQTQEKYYVGRGTKTWLCNEKGHQLDFQDINAEAIVTISGNSENKIIDVIDINTHVTNGLNFLRIEPDLLSKYEQVNKLLTANDKCRIHLSITDGIRISLAGKAIKGFDWHEAESEAMKFVEGPNDISRLKLFSTFWLLNKVAIIVNVDDNILVGDWIDIPFRIKDNPKRQSSNDRASRVICVDKQGDVVTLESNIEKSLREDFLVAWHVRIEFDIKKQILMNVEESRFIRLTMAGSKNIQSTREVVSLRLIDK